ncbi:MAG: PAS domain S-box protein [Bacteroidota bacterium]|nr:PAS domain S-box protein [Bacteroidota bacterium]
MKSPFKNKVNPSEVKPMLSSSKHNFPIVGIGASAGGLEAFKLLLEAIPVDSGMAYVVVQHLHPTHESQLTEILARVTEIPIQEITDEVKIFPNNIYVMPSGKILTSVDGVLKLTPRDSVKTNLVIDIFFTSLAVVWETMAVGVVLSGTGADGTVGLKMIKEHGGTTFVQDESAEFDDMPQSAVDANVVDFVLPAGQIPAQLLKINNASAITHAKLGEVPLPVNEEVVFKQMLQLLHKRSGVDFTFYKQSTVRRRIGRRMALHKRGNLTDYLKFLRNDNDAQDALFQDMLIPVTSFFRDSKTYDTLTEKVLPALLKSKPAEDTIRFWIAGCSTGEEAYSLAICLHELLGKKLSGKTIQIFASDISEPAIKKARAGIYSKAEVQTVSEERLINYFTKFDGSYKVITAIRDMCVFANHNFLKDPPFAKMDLISCRNVLIYMDTFLQKKALTTFHYALKENGILLLGKSETASAAAELFITLEKHDKIYSRKTGIGRYMQVASESREETLTSQNNSAQAPEVPQTDFRKSADAIQMAKSPASVIVNEQMDIVHIHGDIEPFFKLSPGKASLNLLKMAREPLAFEFRAALHKVKTSKDSVIKEEIPVIVKSKQSLVTIEIFPLVETMEPHYLILFTIIHLPAADEKGRPSSSGKQLNNNETLNRNEQLEKELANTREEMLSITEEMAATNEELQTANEELQSSNEEMQSLNAELENSKEELQSGNEELITVNQELLDKQEQLNASRLYAEAIVTNIREPLVVLDKNLRIKTVNQSFYKKFKVSKEKTEGKIFYEIQNHRWDDSQLRKLLEDILIKNKSIEGFSITLNFFNIPHNLLLNARQIINEKDNELLILLSIEDVTDSVLNKQLQESEARLGRERQVFYNSLMYAPAGIAILKGHTHIYEFVNDEYENLVDRKITLGKTVQDLFPEIKQQGIIDILNNVFSTGEPFIANEFPVELVNENTGKMVLRYYNSVLQPIKDDKGNTERLLSHAVEVTQQVEARKLIEASEAKFKNLSENISNMVWTATPDGQRNYFNQHMLDYTGLSIDELKGNGWHKIISPLDIERTLKHWQHSINTDEKFRIENRLRHHDGTYQWHLTKADAQKDEEGKIILWIGTNTNIHEQKNFTEELEKKVNERTEQLQLQNKTFELAENIAQFGSYTWSITTGALEYSDNLFRLLDCEPQEFVPSFEKFLSFVHPDDLQRVVSNGEQTVITGKLVETPYRIISKTGKIKYFRSSGTFSGDGVNRLLIGTVQDITKDVVAAEALVEKEDYLNQVISNAPDAVIVTDEKSIITLWNPKTEAIFGWKAEEVLGLQLNETIIPPQYREGHKEGMKRLLKTGEARILNKTLELTALNKAGKEFPISLTISQATQQGNKLFIAFLRDITLEKQNKEELIVKTQQLVEMNQSLELNNKQLESTNAELASFSYIASHDLKEPLRKIQAFSRRIMEGETFSDKTHDYFNRIIAAGERMQNLIDSLLDFSSINSNELIFESCDLNTIVEESKNDLHISISEKQAIIVHENLPSIMGVCIQISQLITNLIDNAIKYSRPEIKPHIKITAERIHGNEIENPSANIHQEYYALKIADNGIGFEKEFENKIFELFQRLHGKNEYSGTGIGLAIVKKIVTNHNGFITAEGKPNVGSTFTIYIPTS